MTESQLQPGQRLRLGGVEMLLEADVPRAPHRFPFLATRPDCESRCVRPNPRPNRKRRPFHRPWLWRRHREFPFPAASCSANFIPKSLARYQCHKCNRTFCELCVTSRNAGGVAKKMCRTCGVECVPLEVDFRPEEVKGFYARLPGVVIYPFKGSGILVLIVGTFVIAGLQFISSGLFSILTKIIAYGYLFSYMQNIIHATAAEEVQMPELPGLDDVFAGFLRLAGTVLAAFGVAIGLVVARFFEVDVPVSSHRHRGHSGLYLFPDGVSRRRDKGQSPGRQPAYRRALHSQGSRRVSRHRHPVRRAFSASARWAT